MAVATAASFADGERLPGNRAPCEPKLPSSLAPEPPEPSAAEMGSAGVLGATRASNRA